MGESDRRAVRPAAPAHVRQRCCRLLRGDQHCGESQHRRRCGLVHRRRRQGANAELHAFVLDSDAPGRRCRRARGQARAHWYRHRKRRLIAARTPRTASRSTSAPRTRATRPARGRRARRGGRAAARGCPPSRRLRADPARAARRAGSRRRAAGSARRTPQRPDRSRRDRPRRARGLALAQREGCTDSISLLANSTSVGWPLGEPPSGSSDTAKVALLITAGS